MLQPSLFSGEIDASDSSPLPSLWHRLIPFAAAQSGANWTYEGKTGPLVWGKLDPAYAGLLDRATSSRRSTFAARI